MLRSIFGFYPVFMVFCGLWIYSNHIVLKWGLN